MLADAEALVKTAAPRTAGAALPVPRPGLRRGSPVAPGMHSAGRGYSPRHGAHRCCPRGSLPRRDSQGSGDLARRVMVVGAVSLGARVDLLPLVGQ